MKIGTLMQVSQMYQATKTKKNSSSDNAQKGSDKIELSSFGKELSIARKAVSESSEVREEKVADIKAALQSGTYDLSMDRLADKLVDNYFG